MPFKPESFAEMEHRVIMTLSDKTPLLDVPYYICLHDPKDEVLVVEEFENLSHRLEAKGFTSETLRLSHMMIDVLSENGFLEDEVLDSEERIRSELESDLRRILLPGISQKLIEHLQSKDISHCAVLLRYGSLLPFVHLSGILQSIDSRVKCTLVIPYPTTIGTGSPLNISRKGALGYYRGVEVDLVQ